MPAPTAALSWSLMLRAALAAGRSCSQLRRAEAHSSMNIRRARESDAAELTRIAHEAKRHWGYPERWIELWREDLTLTPEFIAGNQVYLAEDGGEALGCCAIVAASPNWMLEHFWIRPAAMGKGLGRRLFEHARTVAAGAGASLLEIDS